MLENNRSIYHLKLFISGRTPKSDLAIANIRKIFSELDLPFELMIVDVLETPQAAEDFRIMATPTLIKTSPLPIQRIIGDLSDARIVHLGLGLLPMNKD